MKKIKLKSKIKEIPIKEKKKREKWKKIINLPKI